MYTIPHITAMAKNRHYYGHYCQMQNATARLISGTRHSDHILPVLRELHWRCRLAYGPADATATHCNTQLDATVCIIDNSRTRGRAYKLLKPHCIIDATKYFFSNRVISTWNNLPDMVVHAPTLSTFKRYLFLTSLLLSFVVILAGIRFFR